MYDPTAVLASIDRNAIWVLLFGAFAIGGNCVFYIAMLRAALAAKMAPMVLLTAVVFLLHDGNYVASANLWFGKYRHWFPILFWGWLIVTAFFAVTWIVLIIRWGRSDTAGRLNRKQWTGWCLASVLVGLTMWIPLKSALDDDLYLLSFMLTINLCAISGLTLYIRRGGAYGQSVLQWTAFTVMGAGFFGCSQFFGDEVFRSPAWIGMALFNVLAGIFLAVAAKRAAGDTRHRVDGTSTHTTSTRLPMASR